MSTRIARRETTHLAVETQDGGFVRLAIVIYRDLSWSIYLSWSTAWDTHHIDSHTQYLVSSLSTRNDTQLIEVDPATGDLLYIARPDVDLFPDEAAALLHVTNCISPIISTVYVALERVGHGHLHTRATMAYNTLTRVCMCLQAWVCVVGHGHHRCDGIYRSRDQGSCV